MDSVIATGWFLKTGKSLNRYLIDPFTLMKSGSTLIAHRSAKRLMLLKQEPYSLINLKVSNLRNLTDLEYTFVTNSEIRDQLDKHFSLTNSRCFDIRFGLSTNEKSMVVLASYVLLFFVVLFRRSDENIQRLQFVMEAEAAGVTVDSMLGPIRDTPKSGAGVDALF